MNVEILLGCVLIGIIAMFVLFVGFLNEEEKRMQEVKVFGPDGKLKEVITVQQLQKNHWSRFHDSTRYGDKHKAGRKPKGKEEEVCISD